MPSELVKASPTSMEEMMTWQRMDTAPKDGTRIIGWTDTGHFVPGLIWQDGGWGSEDTVLGYEFIAWMPFPDAPAWAYDDAA